MATVAEGALAAEMAAAPEPADSEPGAEDAKKTIISLGELVDLALCTPEPGAVNFNLLRAVLHALVQRLDLVDIKAEILDEDTDNVFTQIMENADKLGLKDLRARQTGSAAPSDAERPEPRAESRERRHKSRRSDRSRGGSSHRGSAERAASERAPSQAAPAERAPSERGPSERTPSQPAPSERAPSERVPADRAPSDRPAASDQPRDASTRPDKPAQPATAAPAPSPRRQKSGDATGGGPGSGAGSGGEHSDEFEDVREAFCPPDSAGQPDVARSRSLSGQRISPRGEEEREMGPGSPAVPRRPASSGSRRVVSAETGPGRREEAVDGETAGEGRTEPPRPSREARSSTDSIGVSSGLSSVSVSDSQRAVRSSAPRPTLSELASERLRHSGRQSAVSIASNVEGTPVLADYTSLDRLERRMMDIQQKMEVMELADVLPKVRELQKTITGSQEDVQGLWQSLQLMKKVDANEEGIDKLTQVIETAMAKLKKVRKHTDRLDKQLTDLMGQRTAQARSKTDADKKPVTLVEMETKYNEIKSVIEGLMSNMGQEAVPDTADASQTLRSVGAGIVTWGVLESALENIRGEVKEMGEVTDQTLTSVEETQTEARQQELMETAAADHSSHVSKVKQLLANLSRLVDKHRALEKRVGQMEDSMGENFSDKVLEQLTLLKASASQIQDLRNKLGAGRQPSVPPAGGSAATGGRRGTTAAMGPGWSDLDVDPSAGSMGHLVSDDLSLNLTSLREPSQMDLNHLSDWLNYNKARMEQLEKALVSQSEQVRDFGDRLGDQVVSFRDKLERVERELAGMLGRISSAAQKSGMSREDSQALHDAYARIQTLQMDVEALSSVSKKIVSDRGQIDDELAMLIRALEELKECKVDRATLDELIETKADRSSVEKKVSSWQFEQACQELSEGLGAMLEKVGSQDVDWQHSVDEINADLHRKLDRAELAPLRRYVNVRLKNIMGKLNRLIAEDESPDACTTRRKLIKNLACLSCDETKKITGLTAAPNVPLMDPFPPSIGDRHQISYRIGNIRRYQQMRCEPYKDLSGQPGVFRSHVRQELDMMTHRGVPHHPNCPLYQNRSPHGRCTCVATRFCGGSHTKITCVDTRLRRVGLGAPLMPFGGAQPGRPASARDSQERVARTSSNSSQRPSSSGGRRPPPPSRPPGGPRQVKSTGSGLIQRRGSAAGGLGTKSAPEVKVPFEGTKGEAEATTEAKVKTREETKEETKMEPERVEETKPDQAEEAAAEPAAEEAVEAKPETPVPANEEPLAAEATEEDTATAEAPTAEGAKVASSPPEGEAAPPAGDLADGAGAESAEPPAESEGQGETEAAAAAEVGES